MGAPLARIFDFNSLEVSSALGQRQRPSDEISTAEGPEALVGQQVEVLIVRTPVPPLLGTSLALKGNILGPILVIGTLGVAGAILTESALSFLGIGVNVSTPPGTTDGLRLSS